jgi:hypothetical protein
MCFNFVIPVPVPAGGLESQSQSQLNQPRISNTTDLPKRSPVSDVAVGVKELRVIQSIEKLSPELETDALPHNHSFMNGKVKVGDSRTAAYGAWCVADLAQGSIHERRGIKVIAAGFLRAETMKSGDLIRLAWSFEV